MVGWWAGWGGFAVARRIARTRNRACVNQWCRFLRKVRRCRTLVSLMIGERQRLPLLPGAEKQANGLRIILAAPKQSDSTIRPDKYCRVAATTQSSRDAGRISPSE